MASIYTRPRKDGTVAVQLKWRRNGSWESVTFDDYATAVEYQKLIDRVGAEQMLKVLAAKTGVTQGRDEPSIEAWCTRYVKNLTGVSTGTRSDYERYIRNDLAVIGPLPLSVVMDGETIPGWVNGLQTKGNAPKTIWNKHGFLSGALSAAVPKYLPRNPCDDTRLPQRDDAEMVFLEAVEYAALRGAMTDRWKPITDFLVMSGARFGEVTALTVADIDSDKLTCRINKAWKSTGNSRRPELGPPKTKKSKRTINIPAEAIDLLNLDRAPGELLFHTTAGKNAGPRTPILRHLYLQAWTRTLAKLQRPGPDGKVGDPLHGKRPRPHDLRHTCVSWMIHEGVNFKAIQEHLGHESITTTMDRYGHLDREAGARAAAAISNRLKSVAAGDEDDE